MAGNGALLISPATAMCHRPTVDGASTRAHVVGAPATTSPAVALLLLAAKVPRTKSTRRAIATPSAARLPGCIIAVPFVAQGRSARAVLHPTQPILSILHCWQQADKIGVARRSELACMRCAMRMLHCVDSGSLWGRCMMLLRGHTTRAEFLLASSSHWGVNFPGVVGSPPSTPDELRMLLIPEHTRIRSNQCQSLGLCINWDTKEVSCTIYEPTASFMQHCLGKGSLYVRKQPDAPFVLLFDAPIDMG